MDTSTLTICPSCSYQNTGKYCSNCGQALQIKRITFPNLVHEVFHLFTHLEKGFLYTLRELVVSPGKMQRDYIEGSRSRHQKPFSMFFICVTVFALLMYWVNLALITFYNAGDEVEAMFFNRYMVMLLFGSAPLMIMLTYFFFYSSRYNLAEIGVFILYTISVFFLIIVVVNLLKFIWPTLETRYIEIPITLIYNTVTYVNFFRGSRRWVVVSKAIACSLIFFISIAFTQDAIVDNVLR